MDRPLATRVLLGLATALFVTGCAMGVIGLHPAVQRPAMSRLGMLMAVASLPPWMLATSWRAQQSINGLRTNEHAIGYQMCLEQLAEDPEFVRQLIARIPRQRQGSAQAREHGR